MIDTWRRAFIAAWLALGCAAVAGAQPEPYPSRPVRIVVAFPAGGAADTLARILEQHLQQSLGASVAVENRPGAAGHIASEVVARAAPDGYTLLLGATSMTILPHTRPGEVPDPLQWFEPVTRLVTQPLVIVVPENGPASLAELVSRAHAAPGTIAYASAGVGTTDHLAASLLWTRAGVTALHVPYASSAQEVNDLRQGNVQAAFISLGAVRPLLQAGALRALAVTGAERVAAFPNVPTVAESGYPGFDVTSWYGLFAPAGTPQVIVALLARECAAALQRPEARERIVGLGAVAVANSPEAFAREIGALRTFWPPLIKAAGLPVAP